MFKINDVVCYENYGLCQITDIQSVAFAGRSPRQYYHMKPLFDTCTSTVIKTPTDTDNVIRLAMTKKQAQK
mgnify:CR=1 FL=1